MMEEPAMGQEEREPVEKAKWNEGLRKENRVEIDRQGLGETKRRRETWYRDRWDTEEMLPGLQALSQ